MQDADQDLVAKGVEMVGEPHVINRTDTSELWMTFFRDSEGHLHASTREVPVNDGSTAGHCQRMLTR